MADKRPLTTLVRGTDADDEHADRLRDVQVVIGGHPGARVQQLPALGVLRQYTTSVYDREFTAPEVLGVLLR